MKKTSMVSFLITLLFAAAVCTHGKEYVTDTDGNPVKLGEQYFIQPQESAGGGLVPDANLLPVCSIRETVEPNQLGLPVVFDFLYRAEYFIPLGIPVTIEFKFKSDVRTDCDENSPFWNANASSSAIVLGGRPYNLFTIEKAGEAGANTYKFKSYMGPVGTKPVSPLIGAARQLVVTNDNSKTLLVKFSKFHAGLRSEV